MYRLVYALFLVAVFATACHQVASPEAKLIGDWSMPEGDVKDEGVVNTNSGFDVTSLKADHTFSQTAHPLQAPPAHVLSGVWHVEGDQLVMKFTWAHPTMQEMVGQELRLVISDLQPDKFVSANAEHQQQRFIWTRVK
ncbi:MAG: hypothetical protein ACREIF_19575 [Chthoniobacterales bacterium]